MTESPRALRLRAEACRALAARYPGEPQELLELAAKLETKADALEGKPS